MVGFLRSSNADTPARSWGAGAADHGAIPRGILLPLLPSHPEGSEANKKLWFWKLLKHKSEEREVGPKVPSFPFMGFHPKNMSWEKQEVVVQSPSHVQLFTTPWTAARQASLALTISWSLPKFMYIESVMPSNHLILCHPLLLLPSIFASIRVFSNESAVCIRWLKYWSFSFSISPSNEYSGLISFRTD